MALAALAVPEARGDGALYAVPPPIARSVTRAWLETLRRLPSSRTPRLGARELSLEAAPRVNRLDDADDRSPEETEARVRDLLAAPPEPPPPGVMAGVTRVTRSLLSLPPVARRLVGDGRFCVGRNVVRDSTRVRIVGLKFDLDD